MSVSFLSVTTREVKVSQLEDTLFLYLIHNFRPYLGMIPDVMQIAYKVSESSTLPELYALHANYPNPFNPSTEISFSLPKAADVELTVYNMLGQTVEVVADEFMNAGSHTVVWDGSGVASGVYFYRLSTPEFTDTKKMMLLK